MNVTLQRLGTAVMFAVATPALAADPCASLYGKGYCTDYVNSRIPNKQRGNAENWRGGLPRNMVRAGDVAIFRRIGHVAYVEAVTARNSSGAPERIRISEMNFGRGLKLGTDRSCRATTAFGVRTERVILVSEVDDFFGPTYRGR